MPDQIEFQRESDTPEAFDGRWRVWLGTKKLGVVRKDDDPVRPAYPWGYESVPTDEYPNGRRWRAGFRTRRLAGEALATLHA